MVVHSMLLNQEKYWYYYIRLIEGGEKKPFEKLKDFSLNAKSLLNTLINPKLITH